MTDSPVSQQRLAELVDRQDIYAALLRFARAMDRFDRALFLSAFYQDAVISAGSFVGDPVSLYDWAHGMHEEGQKATMHNLLNHSCDLDGDSAHTETYYLMAGRNHDESNWLAGGRYLDRFERRDGQWKIAFRTTVIEWSGLSPTLPIPFLDVPDLALNGLPTRDTDDPSYRRPLTNQRKLQKP